MPERPASGGREHVARIPAVCRNEKALLIPMRIPFLLWLSAPLLLAAEPAALWSGKVQPLLDVQCTKCHGVLEQKGGLQLDTVEALLQGGDEGQVVVPGKPEESRLYTQLAAGADPHMPPKKQLTDAEREVVREWIVSLAAAPIAAPAAVEVVPELAGVAEAADFFLEQGWQKAGVQPAAAVDDRTWCRRVYLDLAGRIPSDTELADFLNSPDKGRRAALVDRLLVSPEYAVRMRELWDVFLMGRGARDSSDDRRKKNNWWGFLERAFSANRPWNEAVRDMLAGRGDDDHRRGASWFLYERKNNHQAIAEAVAPVVYGTRIDCAQCHDHPLAREIKQAHYWGLVAAFNRSKNVDGSTVVNESAVGGFVNFTNLKKESQPALVVLLNGRKVEETRPPDGAKEEDSADKYAVDDGKSKVPKQSRRAAFADAATRENPLLARAFVNRMWAVLMGRGLVHPVDEMNARNVPSHPALLDWLAGDFARSGYDVRRLLRGLVLSRGYALGRSECAPETFAGMPERPLTAEQLARSWRVAAGLPPEDDALRRAAVKAIPEVMAAEYNATFQQAQFLSSTAGLTEILQPVPGSFSARIAAQSDPAEMVRAAFLATLARLPDAEEAEAAQAFLQGRAADREAGARDLLWALLTGAEFLTAP